MPNRVRGVGDAFLVIALFFAILNSRFAVYGRVPKQSAANRERTRGAGEIPVKRQTGSA